MKKFISLFLIACLALATIGAKPTTAEVTTFNDMSDVLALLQLITNGTEISDEQIIIYDLNGDSEVTAADALLAMKNVAGILDPRPRETVRLTAEQEKKIKEAFLAETIRQQGTNSMPEDVYAFALDDIYLSAYYGNYGGAELVQIQCTAYNYSYPGIDPFPFSVAGFTIPGNWFLYLYVDDAFMSIEDAYDQGKITKQDVCDMQEYPKYYTTGYSDTTAYEIRPRETTRLATEQVKKIKEDFLTGLLNSYNYGTPDITLDDIHFLSYYGNYGGAELVQIYCEKLSYGPSFWEVEKVAGFYIPGGFKICLYIDGEFMNVGEAYRADKITKQDVCDMQEYQKYRTICYNELTPDESLDIRTAFLNYVKQSSSGIPWTANDIDITHYYGDYSEGTKVFSAYGSNSEISTIWNGGVTYVSIGARENAEREFALSGRWIYIYKDGIVLPFEQAYEQGWLSQKDIIRLHMSY